MLLLIHYCVATVFRQPISESEISLRKAWLREIVEMKKKKGGFGELRVARPKSAEDSTGPALKLKLPRLEP